VIAAEEWLSHRIATVPLKKLETPTQKSVNRSIIVTLGVSVESIGCRIISETETVIQNCSHSIQTLLPRTFLASRRNRVRAAHLNPRAMPKVATIVVIPYSIRAIS
jgi:hypothetical protein